MPKDIKRKQYQPPLVYDIGGANLNVVGGTYLGCNAGSGGTRCCITGSPGTGFGSDCNGGDQVAYDCITGSPFKNNKACWSGMLAAPTICRTGSTNGDTCWPGNVGGVCGAGPTA